MEKKFGEFGGSYVPEKVQNYLDKLEQNYLKLRDDENFKKEFSDLLNNYVGRPSPLYFAEKLSEKIGCRVYLKREDLNHTGAHKINNTLGQALLAKEMGYNEIIAETGAGQHGVATATAAALLDMNCKVFMGSKDIEKQKMNVRRMQLLGTEVVEVEKGDKSLKEAVDVAIKYLSEHEDVFYLLGSVVGPHPYPTMVRDFQSIIGEETRNQILEKEGELPTELVACVGGGSNAMGLFNEFLEDEKVRLVGVEAEGKGLSPGKNSATIATGEPGIIQGFRCLLIQDGDGNPGEVHSVASGLDYPGLGPELSMLSSEERIENGLVDDETAINSFRQLSELEGIIPALESSHAVGYVLENSEKYSEDDIVIVNLSGRGDKDLETVMKN